MSNKLRHIEKIIFTNAYKNNSIALLVKEMEK